MSLIQPVVVGSLSSPAAIQTSVVPQPEETGVPLTPKAYELEQKLKQTQLELMEVDRELKARQYKQLQCLHTINALAQDSGIASTLQRQSEMVGYTQRAMEVAQLEASKAQLVLEVKKLQMEKHNEMRRSQMRYDLAAMLGLPLAAPISVSQLLRGMPSVASFDCGSAVMTPVKDDSSGEQMPAKTDFPFAHSSVGIGVDDIGAGVHRTATDGISAAMHESHSQPYDSGKGQSSGWIKDSSVHSDTCVVFQPPDADWAHFNHYHFIVFVERLGVFEYCPICFKHEKDVAEKSGETRSSRRTAHIKLPSAVHMAATQPMATDSSSSGRGMDNAMCEPMREALRGVTKSECHRRDSLLAELSDDKSKNEDNSDGGGVGIGELFEGALPQLLSTVPKLQLELKEEQLLSAAVTAGMNVRIQNALTECCEAQRYVPFGVAVSRELRALAMESNCRLFVSLEDYCHVHFLVYCGQMGLMIFCRQCGLLRKRIADNALALTDIRISKIVWDIGLRHAKHRQSRLALSKALLRLKHFTVPLPQKSSRRSGAGAFEGGGHKARGRKSKRKSKGKSKKKKSATGSSKKKRGVAAEKKIVTKSDASSSSKLAAAMATKTRVPKKAKRDLCESGGLRSSTRSRPSVPRNGAEDRTLPFHAKTVHNSNFGLQLWNQSAHSVTMHSTVSKTTSRLLLGMGTIPAQRHLPQPQSAILKRKVRDKHEERERRFSFDMGFGPSPTLRRALSFDGRSRDSSQYFRRQRGHSHSHSFSGVRSEYGYSDSVLSVGASLDDHMSVASDASVHSVPNQVRGGRGLTLSSAEHSPSVRSEIHEQSRDEDDDSVFEFSIKQIAPIPTLRI